MPAAASALAVFDTLTERRDTRNPLYLQAKTCLREAILAKRVGERLPSERDLAKRFGVSFMTARRAVSDLVDEGLLMRRHGKGTYVRHEGADAGPALAIGLLAGDEPALATLVSAVCQAARAAGHGAVTVAGRWGDLVPIDPDHACARHALAGLIGVGVTAAQAAETARAALHLPLVLVDAEAPVAGCDAVCADHAAAARIAVEHLQQLGHRRIAFIGGGGASAERRAIGFRMAVRRLGLPDHEERLAAPADAVAAFARLLAGGPTALVCADDAIAALCLRLAGERGVVVPRDLSLVACDELLPSAFADPRISTVAVSRRELATAAVQRLMGRLASGAVDDSPALVPARLAVRASSSALRAVA
jgi:DNA-binding LacI/PurR family transcriptional regulator